MTGEGGFVTLHACICLLMYSCCGICIATLLPQRLSSHHVICTFCSGVMKFRISRCLTDIIFKIIIFKMLRYVMTAMTHFSSHYIMITALSQCTKYIRWLHTYKYLQLSPKCWHDISIINIYIQLTYTPQMVGSIC